MLGCAMTAGLRTGCENRQGDGTLHLPSLPDARWRDLSVVVVGPGQPGRVGS
jgi:hypothetical protein